MISAAKLAANRRNAQHSTGPKTEAGKAISSRNAIKHGLYASNALLDGEDPEEFAAFRDGLLESLEPADAIQHVLADRAIVVAWKLRRVGDVEDAVVNYFREGRNSDRETQTPAERLANFFAGTGDGLQLDHLSQYEQRLQRSLHAALRQLKQLQKTDGQDSRDTGLRPVREVIELKDGSTTDVQHRSHGREVRVTVEPSVPDHQNSRNEPTDAPKSPQATQIHSAEHNAQNCGDCLDSARFSAPNAPLPNPRAADSSKSRKIASRTGFAPLRTPVTAEQIA